MSDTSLVFNLLAKDKTGTTFSKMRGAALATGRSISQALAGSATPQFARLQQEIDKSRSKVRQLVTEFDRTGNVDLFKQINQENRTIAQLERMRRAVADLGAEASRSPLGRLGAMLPEGVARALSSGLNNASTAATNLTTNVWNLIPAVAALAAGMALASPAAHLLGGALASLPAIAVGVGAAFSVVKLGTMGLSDAYRQMTTSSGGAAAAAGVMQARQEAVARAAKQVARAERDVAEAQRSALAVQERINRARKEAAENLEDLNRELSSARLDEEAAVLAVADAERELSRVQRGSNQDDIRRADLAYRQALATLEDVRDRVGDLGEEHEEANEKGVEGSDLVRDALEEQRQAQLRVADAIERQKEAVDELAKAQRELTSPSGGGGGMAQQMVKLAPAAREFLKMIIGLKPAFERLRLNVQQRLFAGLAGDVKRMALAWLPQLNTSLGGMATTFNGLLRNLTVSLSDPRFIKDVAAGVESIRRALSRVGAVVTGPLVGAFGKLARAADPFIQAMGDEVAKVLFDFSEWIDRISQNGQLDQFMQKSAGYLHDVFDMLRDLGSIAGSVIDIIFGTNVGKEASKSPWEALKTNLDKLATWLKDPENQKKVQEWIDKIENFVKKAIEWGHKIEAFATKVSAIVNSISTKITNFRNNVVGIWNGIIGFFNGLPGKITKAASGMFDGIKNAFRNALNWIIGKWNALEFRATIPESAFGIPIPGGGSSIGFGTPNIPRLARGGIVPATPGGRLILAGEGGEDEAVVPLSKMGGGNITLGFAPGDSDLDRLFAAWFHKALRTGKIQAYVGGQRVTVGRA